MSVTEALRRFQCDRCKTTEYAAMTKSIPSGWVYISIDSNSRLGNIRHLCNDCRNALDQLLYDQVAS